MRKTFPVFAFALALLAGCVTINVYFPAAAAQEAADKVISNIIGPAADAAPPAPASSAAPVPSADAAHGDRAGTPLAALVLNAIIPAANAAESQPDLTIRTPQIDAIEARMRSRFQSTLQALLAAGAVGFTHNGDVALHDAAKIALPERARANQAIAAENADRAELYKAIAAANGHPEWAPRMREAFAKQWIDNARPGWFYQDASGNWRRK